MEELNHFLDKQNELNVSILEELVASQDTLQHNLNIALELMRGLQSEYLQPQKRRQVVQQTYEAKHRYILNLLQVERVKGRLEATCPKTLYVNRLFDISVRVAGDAEQHLSLLIFSSESLPELIQTNHQGGPIIKGTTTIKVTGKGTFKKVSISETSKNFPNRKFIIVIKAQDKTIRPMIIDNVSVM